MENKIVIIPDVHGRPFWKKYVEENETSDIIFLGDYVDPYSYEGITALDAYENFKEIIEFAKCHKDNVTLLIGNHDASYFMTGMPKCRYDYERGQDIKQLFLDNINLFKMMTVRTVNNKTVAFSHSFICKKWADNIYDYKDKTVYELQDIVNNTLYSEDLTPLCISMSHVGRARGGYEMYGSMVWSDVCETGWYATGDIINDNFLTDVDFNIFGHTQLRSNIIVGSKFACVDVRDGFLLTEEGYLTNKALNVNVKVV